MLGNKGLAVNAHARPDLHVVLDDRERSDADVVADLVQLADVRLVAGLEPFSDAVPGVDDRVGADDGAVADDRFELARPRSRGRSSDDGIVLDDAVLAEPDTRVNDGVYADHAVRLTASLRLAMTVSAWSSVMSPYMGRLRISSLSDEATGKSAAEWPR